MHDTCLTATHSIAFCALVCSLQHCVAACLLIGPRAHLKTFTYYISLPFPYPGDAAEVCVSLQSVAAATPLDGPVLQRYLILAKETSIWLSLGGFQEYCSTDPQRLQNCHVIVNSAGQIVATYRKVHLFDVEVFNGPVLKETSFTVPGKEVRSIQLVIVCSLPFALGPWPFALCLCPLAFAHCPHLHL